MAEELIDEVDPEGNVIATHPKSYLKGHMFMHRVSLIIPMAKEHKILLSKRPRTSTPILAHGAAQSGARQVRRKRRGGCDKGDARGDREDIPDQEGRVVRLCEKEYKGVFSIFTTTAPVSPGELKLDPEEIQYSKEFEIGEVLRMLKENPDGFAPTFICAITEFAKHFGK